MRNLWCITLILLMACGQESRYEGNFVYEIAKSDPELIEILEDADRYRIQIIYTQVKKDSLGNPVLADHTFRLLP